MTLLKYRLGDNEDGSPHYLYVSNDPTRAVVVTGPITGTVETADGTTYDVTESVIETDMEHHGEVGHAIGIRHEEEGHPKHNGAGDDPFFHSCNDLCGALTIKEKLVEPGQAMPNALMKLRGLAIPSDHISLRATSTRKAGGK